MKKYSTLTDDRYLILFIKYLNVVKNYGENAKYMTKIKMVSEAAELVSISPERAARIINRMLRERNMPNKITIQECNEMLEKIQNTYNVINEQFERKVEALNRIFMRVGIDRTHEEVKAMAQEFLINS